MSKKWVRFFVIALGLHGLTGWSSDSDIDVESARARYREQQVDTDRAKSAYDAANARLQPYLAALNTAKSRYASAESRTTSARNRLAQVNSDISSVDQRIRRLESENQTLRQRSVDLRRQLSDYESDVSRLERQVDQAERDVEDIRRRIRNEQGSGEWECVYVDRGHEEHRGGHRATRATRAEAAAAAEAACLVPHGNCVLSSCQQTSDELESLRRQLREAESRRDNLVTQKDRAEASVRSARYELDQNDSEQQNNLNQISSLERQRSDLNARRSDAQRQLSDAERDQSIASGEVQRAESDVARERVGVARAKSEYDTEQAELNRRLAYLRQVEANYEVERQNAVRLGSQRGYEHGGREASDRAPNAGADAGRRDGEAAGRSKGQVDAKERSYVKGYAVGRRDAASDTTLAQSYQTGRASGTSIAVRKASLEKFPMGYNDTFKQISSGVPAHAALVDITDQIPSDPGDNGRDLRNLRQDVVTVPSPSYQVPVAPIRNVPTPSLQTPSIPSRDNRYNQPPCDGLRRPEFETLCKQNYDSSYASSYSSRYSSAYSAAYNSAFTQSAAPAYDDAFAVDEPSEFVRGKQIGAEHQGVLSGFDERSSGANSEQYARGIQQLNEDLGTGHLIIPRSVQLSETSGDGVLQPGEAMVLSLVVDNHGKLASPLDNLRLKITNTVNAKSLSVPLRGLPALAGQTRTTLKGVVSAKSSALFAGDQVALVGVIEIQKSDDTFEEIFSFTASKVTHFPVELVAVEPVAALPVGKWTSVPFKLQNMTEKATDVRRMRILTKPKNVEVDNKDGFEVPPLEAGATTIVTLPVMPGVWAGGAPVIFSAETLNAEGAVVVDQRFKKDLLISRVGRLTLLNSAGQPSDGTPIVVKAGGTVAVKVIFEFKGTTQRGPFVMRYSSASDPNIKPWNSTVRVNYGMISPGTVLTPKEFTFQVPATLKGQQWVALALDEGGAAIHMLQVWLDVR